METGPSALIEAIVGTLVPPASREHVLGDLRERAATPRQYVAEAIAVVPLVVFSQVRRTLDPLLLANQAFALFLVFRPQRFTRALDLVAPGLPIAAALLVLALRDAYRPARVAPHSPEHIAPAFDTALARALVDAAVAAIAAWLARPALGTLVIGGFLMLIPVRVSWDMLFRADGYRRLAMSSLDPRAMTKDAWRLALEKRRDILRTSWLFYLTPFVVMGYLPALFRPAPRLWVVAAEASITAAALLILRGITRRMADRLQQDINDLQSGE